MKSQLFALIGLGLLLVTASAYAQIGVVKANVPFNFIVEKAELPAGTYLIDSLGLTGKAMTIQSVDRKVIKMVLPNACESTRAQETTKLVFHRYGDQYFLAQVWTAGNDQGEELPTSRREREVAMDHPSQNVVVVAALR
jgi:hypothetical protein